jgi:hypothetical protein
LLQSSHRYAHLRESHRTLRASSRRRMIVARRFIAGVRDHMACVPEGRLNSERGVEIFTLNLSGTPDS